MSAWRWLKDGGGEGVRRTLKAAIYAAALLIPVQIVLGDFHGLNTLKHQPQKIAAIEAIWETERGAPLLLFNGLTMSTAAWTLMAPLLEPRFKLIELSRNFGHQIAITAGMDMTIEEFETVGNAVKAFASENATVVVGTVIDPEMHDELRVTVVATGIGAERKPDITLVKNNMVQERPARQPLISEALQSRVMEEAPAKVVNAEPQARREPDYLDIPAFLRKQAD